MNEVAMIDKNTSVERTPEVIALEINSITENLRKIFLLNSIEIGRRLAEAKIMIGHGEWGNWLKKSFNYSQRTASNLIGIFEQYGSSQMVIFCDNAKSQALANLSYTQAVLLMGIPMEEREEFIEKNDIDSMTTRELQEAIKGKKELENKAKELETKVKELEDGWEGTKRIADKSKLLAEEKTQEAQRLLEEKEQAESDKQAAEAIAAQLQDDLKKEKEKSKKEINRLGLSIEETKKLLAEAQASGNNDEVERLSESLVKADNDLVIAQQKIEELERQLTEPIEVTAAPVVEKIPEEVEKELNELRERTKELEAKVAQQSNPVVPPKERFRVHLDSLVDGFRDLLSSLAEIEEIEEQERYKQAVLKLIGKMSERLKQ
ncbi:DUF3102 domain-containing protein [Desulfosporosinus sp. OT]|uniref:DUF3102 domain-containing protein n=1 Tax=Desulfosporosinus sp. OT TaxID=913865 RepID=UPI0002239F7E|nr:DUF3102 domain-containing protein [Desulfosporosinus sp. OT]EGW40677.1 hypothetical protein DOT_1300 [Desulfosporosinus sp. OT]